ncbi:hypothetical protein GE21DRAFT_3016 [Neurospora crassa]|uniref:Uncharacterized protein n=1 Tax=Neurospora crassa (strain ATCC 24698 / 74-OR23-1A / CBS 708.71 / DSM 1257 / FGSC 987) TaxID=367110 RepID=Q1K8G3_NEUCR|nr:hypothetical protein NCU05448 [Neurospora crassa OR74A]EAA33903.3 hypothetical protein NCU05448 [Neurospora crassa OR74A]KHE85258.1 hypothetical protein GE21DRAFT_3016 [Neurospora crassa]|eukprot:XP_963139.3 hypothetical protein NCU05448 [Neurospora crassa OR74A]
MPWVDVAEQNPWLSSDDEGTPVLCVSSGPVVVDTAPTIKEEHRGLVVLEIPPSSSSSSPSPSLKGEDNEGQDDIPKLPVTGSLPAPIAVPDGRSTSSHPSPSNSHINTPEPTTPIAPSAVDSGEGSYKEEVHHKSPSTAHAAVHHSSASVAAASETKRRTSSESLSPVPTENAYIDDDEDGAELKGPVRNPPCFLCVTKVTLRDKGDSVCDLYPEIDEGSSLPEVSSRAEFTALKRRVKSVEASLRRQAILRRHSEPRKRRAGRGNSDQVKKDDKGPELPDSEDEESYEKEETEDEWLP